MREELRLAIEPPQQTLASQSQTITGLERTAMDHSDQLTALNGTVSTLAAQVKRLTDRCKDLEGRSRRNNIWLIGALEGVEGPRPTEFVTQLLKDTLGLDDAPLLDRTHRTLRPKPKDGDLLRPLFI